MKISPNQKIPCEKEFLDENFTEVLLPCVTILPSYSIIFIPIIQEPDISYKLLYLNVEVKKFCFPRFAVSLTPLSQIPLVIDTAKLISEMPYTPHDLWLFLKRYSDKKVCREKTVLQKPTADILICLHY